MFGNPLEKLFRADAVKESKRLVELLKRHEEKNRPLADARFTELDAQACEIGGRLNAAVTARSPTAGPLEAELRAIQHRRESAFYPYNTERDRLYRELEALTKPVINRFSAECQARLAQIDGNELKKVGDVRRVYDSAKDRNRIFLPTNGHVRERARQLTEDARRKVDGMQHSTLDQIQAVIVQFQAAFEKLDFNELREIEAAEWQLEAMMPSTALSTSGKHDVAILGPASSKASGGWQLNFLGGRE
jgi:uncharacterized protein YjbJ (UPF0337 family)